MAKQRNVNRNRNTQKPLWTTQEISLLKKLFPTNPTSKIAVRFGRETDAVKKKAARMGLRKARRYLKSIGRA
jgi:hypothetical protein